MPLPDAPAFVPAADPDAHARGVDREFLAVAGRPAAVLAAAPGRVNLIGEHVDYNAGRCLPLALPHATYAAVGPREDGVLRIRSLQREETLEVAMDTLGPGRVSGWAAYVAGVVWALRPALDLPGLDVVVDGTVPVGAGLSSSAALECAVALAVAHLAGRADDEGMRCELAAACVCAETEMAGAPTGGMDQTVSLLARSGHALLLDFADDTSRQVRWTPEEHGLALLVIDTRVSHQLTDGGYGARRRDCQAAADALGLTTLRQAQGAPERLEALEDPRVRRRARHVLTEMERVDRTVAALEQGDLASIGPLLDASHASLRDDYEVSCVELDVAVAAAVRAGARGARMTGGGFGGSALALVETTALDRVATAVAAAFAEHGFAPPAFLLAPASAGARVLRSR